VNRVFEIAGTTFELAPDRGDLEILLPPSFAAFSSSGAPRFRIRLEESEEMRADPLPCFLPYRFELREDGEGYSFLNPLDDGVRRLGSIRSRASEDRLLFPPDGHDWSDPDTRSAVSSALSDFIKTCLQVRLLEQDVTMLHASGIERNGSGYLFLGPSGAGKSTAAGLLGGAAGATVLNDDIVALGCGERGATLYSTPWLGTRGGSCSPGNAPLACIFALRREEGRKLERLQGKRALGALLANLPWLGESARLTDATMALATRLAARVPLYSLSFSLEEDLWGRIDASLAAVDR
jgi:hypothetical protein